jgi:hypothetical protein
MLEMTAGGFRIPLTPRLSTPATPDDPAEIRGAALCRPAGGASSDSPDHVRRFIMPSIELRAISLRDGKADMGHGN